MAKEARVNVTIDAPGLDNLTRKLAELSVQMSELEARAQRTQNQIDYLYQVVKSPPLHIPFWKRYRVKGRR